eukprot:scaffold17061_cov70-Phaeocystis_antarctica.AAC.1
MSHVCSRPSRLGAARARTHTRVRPLRPTGAQTPATSRARDADYLLVGLLVRPVGHQARARDADYLLVGLLSSHGLFVFDVMP